jgi:hypothetical protein
MEGMGGAAAEFSEKMTTSEDAYTIKASEDGWIQRDEQFLARLACNGGIER